MTPTRIYCATCLVTGKLYFGITGKTVEERSSGHVRKALGRPSTKFHRAIRKYGPDRFEFLELFVYPTLEAAKDAEMALISALDTMNVGYNASAGGDSNPSWSAETREKLRVAHTGRKQSPALVEKRAAALRGRKRPPQVGAKISAALKGRVFTEEWRAKMSAAALRKPPMSSETRKLLSAAGRRRKGKPVSQDRRDRTSATLRGRKLSPEHRAAIAAGLRRRALELSTLEGTSL